MLCLILRLSDLALAAAVDSAAVGLVADGAVDVIVVRVLLCCCSCCCGCYQCCFGCIIPLVVVAVAIPFVLLS